MAISGDDQLWAVATVRAAVEEDGESLDLLTCVPPRKGQVLALAGIAASVMENTHRDRREALDVLDAWLRLGLMECEREARSAERGDVL